MKVLGKRVLVEEVMTKIERKVILTAEKEKEPDNFNIERRIIQVGEDALFMGINVGDVPIFGTYTQPAAVKTITKDNKGMTLHCIYDTDNIVAVEAKQEV